MKKQFLAVLVLISFFTAGLWAEKLQLKEKKVLKPGIELWMFFDASTPAYIIDGALKKGINPAILFEERNVEWIRKNLEKLKGSKPVVFVSDELTKVAQAQLEEFLKFFNYEVTVYFIASDKKIKTITLPTKSVFRIDVEKRKTGGIIYTMTKGKAKEDAKKLSALDERSLQANNPRGFTVGEGIIFKKHSTAFINIDSMTENAAVTSCDKRIIFSTSEKKQKEFIEK